VGAPGPGAPALGSALPAGGSPVTFIEAVWQGSPKATWAIVQLNVSKGAAQPGPFFVSGRRWSCAGTKPFSRSSDGFHGSREQRTYVHLPRRFVAGNPRHELVVGRGQRRSPALRRVPDRSD